VARRFGGARRAFWTRPIFALAAAATLIFACTAIVTVGDASLPTPVRAIAEAVGLPVQAPAPPAAPSEAPAAEAPRAFTPAKMPRTEPVISCEDDEDEQDAEEDTSEPAKLVCDDDSDEGEEPGSSDAAADDDDDDGDDAGLRAPDGDDHEGVPAAGPCPKHEDADEDADADDDDDDE
jgi:hypothetical protein